MRWCCSKPQAVTAQSLDSAAIDYHFYSSPPHHLPYPLSESFCFPPSYRPASVAVVFVAPLIYTRSPPPFLACNAVHLDVDQTYPLPVSAARSAPRTAYLRLPSYTALFAPLLPPLDCIQVPVGTRVPPCLFVPPPSLCAALFPVIFWDLVTMGVLFVQGREARAPPLPVSRSSRPPVPPLHGHSSAVRLPCSPPLPPAPSPLAILIPSLSSKSVGRNI